MPVVYRGNDLGIGFRADMIVEDGLLLELTVDGFSPVHLAQIMTYLRLQNIKRGLLLNFNTELLKTASSGFRYERFFLRALCVLRG